MSALYSSVQLTVNLQTQYHIGSGYGLGRIIDSLLRVDQDSVPIIPGSTISGLTAQSMHDLLEFACFNNEIKRCCDFHFPNKNKIDNLDTQNNKVFLPCEIIKPNDEPCLMCFFFGSTAKEGVIQWMDFTCETDKDLLRPMLKSKYCTGDERRQYIQPYFSHKQNMRTRTVMEKHFFNQEEGADYLKFAGIIRFQKPISEEKAAFLASAFKNVHAIGRRKSRGKGVCEIKGSFIKIDNKLPSDVISDKDSCNEISLTELVNKLEIKEN